MKTRKGPHFQGHRKRTPEQINCIYKDRIKERSISDISRIFPGKVYDHWYVDSTNRCIRLARYEIREVSEKGIRVVQRGHSYPLAYERTIRPENFWSKYLPISDFLLPAPVSAVNTSRSPQLMRQNGDYAQQIRDKNNKV